MQIGFSKNISENLIDDFLITIVENLKKEKKLKLSKFGTFSIRAKKSRIGRNPKTKEQTTISDRDVVLFKASKEFKDLVNSKMIHKNNDAYKSIGEVAKILNLVNKKKGTLNTHTIRFWEKEFKQIKPKILNGNRRYYNNDTIEVLKKVKYLLKDQGMTIMGVKKVLNSDKSFKLDELPNNSINADYSLKNKLKKISDLIKKIKSLK